MAKKSNERREKGCGYIFKKQNRYYAEFKINGKRKIISLKTTNRKDAESEAKNHYAIINSRTNEELAIHVQKARELEIIKEVTLESSWKKFINDPARPNSGQGTLKNYKCSLNRFLKWINSEYPKIKTFNQVDNILAKYYSKHLYSSGISAKTYNDHIKALMLIFRILMQDTGIKQNPFDKSNIFRKIERKQGREKLSRTQLKHLLSVFKDTDLYLMHKEENEILFYIGAYTGLRLIDCVYLEWNNIDVENNLIRCIPKKTERIQRNFSIHLFSLLKEQLLSLCCLRFLD